MANEIDFDALKALMADKAGYALGPERASAVEAPEIPTRVAESDKA